MRSKSVAVFFCFILLISGTVAAESAKSAEATSAAEKPPLVQYGFEHRIRTENWNNLVDYSAATDDERRQLRYRTKVWLSLNTDRADLHLKLNNEFKKQYVSELRLNMDEVLIENLYVDFKKLAIRGLSLRVGRQDLTRGEGFMLMDGTPVDGSRTLYFNAIDLAYAWKRSKFEVIAILNPRQDRLLPRIHDQRKYLAEWDEQAVGFYYTDRNSKSTDVDAYYFLKKEVHDYRAATHAQFQPDRHVSTLGARVSRRIRDDITVTGEFAVQWGAQKANPAVSAPAADIHAWGGYGYVRKTFAHRTKPYVLGGTIMLSGDNPSTAAIESFDPIFSRYPKWGDLYIYSMTAENGVGYWANNRMLQAEAGFTPWSPVTLRTTLYVDHAFHPNTKDETAVFGSGQHRGENLQARMDYTVNPRVKGHVTYEIMLPGSFYAARSNAYFFRAEINYSFHGSLNSLSKN